jgi:glycerophosphoryl diester phosphodiesterase
MRRFLILLLSFSVLSCFPVRKYQTLPAVQAWETDIQKFEQLDKSVTYSEDAILFAGSSSIRLWSTLEKDMAPYPVIQRGYGGAKLSDFAFLNETGRPRDDLFRPDSLQLNEKGYAVWTKIIKEEMKKVVALPKIQIIAHSGASYIAPENTVASANLAWEQGADAVELDIYLSKDNKIMVSHDPNTRRTSGKVYTIKETDSDTLRKLDVGSFKDIKYRGEKMPFLEEIIQTVPSGKELVVEIKCGSEVLPYLKEVITSIGKNKKFVFISFDFQTISDTKKVFPENSCYWLCSNSELLKKNINLVSGADLEGISLSYNIIDKEIAGQAKELKLELFSWTIDNPDEAKRLISLGVKGITTNRPGWMKEQISLY